MNSLPSKCTPGYQLSGSTGAFGAAPVAHGAGMRWVRLGRDAVVVRMQKLIVTTDVPGATSALSFVRRP